MTVTIAEWHDRTFVPGREYYPIGNRHLYGVVQTDVSGPGAPVTLVFGDPDYFDGPKGMKRDALLFDPERGLDVTALTVFADDRPFRALHTNVRATWDPEGAPVLTIRWWAGPLLVEEKILASMKSPAVYRRVRIENRAEFPCVPAIRADFVPNPRMETNAAKLGERGLSTPSTLSHFGLLASATWAEVARAVLSSDGDPAVELRLSELQPGESVSATLIYALTPEHEGLVAMEALDEEAIDQDEAVTRAYRAEGAVMTCQDSLAKHVFDSAYRGILMVTSDEGRLNVGMWQYNKQWVRDSSQTALGALHVGLHEEAGLALRKVLTDLVDDSGRTVIANAFVEERHEQFDQAGQLLFALSQYVLWTGDTSIVKEHWSRISAAAERLCNSPCRDPKSGLFHNEREFWERSDIHGVENGYELSYQLWPVLGLTATPVFQSAMPSDDVVEKTERWAKTGREIWQAAMTHPTLSFVHEGRLIKRRRLDGSIQETMTPQADLKLASDIPLGNDRVSFLNPDTSSVVPIAYGLVDPTSDVAKKTVDGMEKLWNLRWDFGGYDRYHTSSQPDTPGPWGFASMFVARANHACGNLDRALRTIHWFANTAGGKGGSWFEYVPIIQTDMEREVLNPGIVLWIWAEMGILFTRQVLGIVPEIEGVRIKPRLLPGMGEVRASVPLRGRKLEIELNEENPEAGRVRYDGGEWQALENGELFLPWA